VPLPRICGYLPREIFLQDDYRPVVSEFAQPFDKGGRLGVGEARDQDIESGPRLEGVAKTQFRVMGVEQAPGHEVILAVYLVCFVALGYLGQLCGQSAPSRAYLQDSLAILYRGELDDPLNNPLVSEIVLTQAAPLHFLMNRLILDPPESSSTIRLARSLAGSLS